MSSKTQTQSVVDLHFIIVGGGLGGFSAAYALRKAGYRVTVLEQSNGISNKVRLLSRPQRRARTDARLGRVMVACALLPI